VPWPRRIKPAAVYIGYAARAAARGGGQAAGHWH
jgi:hypothetical protein